jgi:hypothetical protein
MLGYILILSYAGEKYMWQNFTHLTKLTFSIIITNELGWMVAHYYAER